MIPDELDQEENRGQDFEPKKLNPNPWKGVDCQEFMDEIRGGEDRFCEKIKEVLENNEIKPPTYQQSFEVWEQEDGQANP